MTSRTAIITHKPSKMFHACCKAITLLSAHTHYRHLILLIDVYLMKSRTKSTTRKSGTVYSTATSSAGPQSATITRTEIGWWPRTMDSVDRQRHPAHSARLDPTSDRCQSISRCTKLSLETGWRAGIYEIDCLVDSRAYDRQKNINRQQASC